MNENIKLILSLSLSASILAVIIFAIKPLIKNRIPKSIQYYIWMIVILRLVLPFSYDTSIMNRVFYNENVKISVERPESDTIATAVGGTNGEAIKDNVSKYNSEKASPTAGFLTIRDLIINNMVYIWLLGALAVFMINIIGYLRFVFCLKASNKPAGETETILLEDLSGRRRNITLFRNEYAVTPMLIGILRPCIIIPDMEFSELQLKNIFRHELTHLRNFDILIKWVVAAAVSLHWFNPLMYLVKREINRACELSCDEAVIKNMDDEEKQDYGDTLISVVAEHKYPVGAISTTMCEEKRTLKERLVSIMNHSKKTRLAVIVSAILVLAAATGAIVLGAGVGMGLKNPPNIYIGSEFQKTKQAIRGGYNWTNGNQHILADSDHPKNFKYQDENTITVQPGEQIILGTQKIKADKKYAFTLDSMEIYRDGVLVDIKSPEPSFLNDDLYLASPSENGNYIYCLTLGYKNKGTCQYGFIVKVGNVKYDTGSIDTLISIIMSSPRDSSNPGAYIAAHQSEYNAIVDMGEKALPYLNDISSKDKGLKGIIASHLVRDIEKKANTSGE